MSHELGAVLAAYMPEDGRNITANAWSELIGSLTDSVGRHHGFVSPSRAKVGSWQDSKMLWRL